MKSQVFEGAVFGGLSPFITAMAKPEICNQYHRPLCSTRFDSITIFFLLGSSETNFGDKFC